VITGFNTDIEHDGVVYHVQTEDKGLETPIILSLVYTGGAILASKRAPYEDLIAEGYSDEALSERLKRQHRLICAAIHSGRINDLKKMSGRVEETEVGRPSVEVEAPELEIEIEDHELFASPAYVDDSLEIEYSPMTQEWVPPPPPTAVEATPESESVPAYSQASEQDVYDIREPQTDEVWTEGGVVITLLDDEEFFSGETRTLRVLVTSWSNGDHTPIVGATVSIKILGTTFRPLIYSLKTQKDGVATVSTQIPQFNSGRAAVLIRAVAKDQAAELRRIIHPD
jgi:hypothetical protein